MGFDIQITHSVEEVGQETWDCLSGGQPFASYRWYRFGETVLIDNIPIYIILSQLGQPVARGTFWLKKRELLPIHSKVVRRSVEALLHCWPLLACHSPLTSVSGLILPASSLRDEAIETIAHVALEQGRQYHASFVTAFYLEAAQACESGWPGAFTNIIVPGPGTRLPINWLDFEGYLAHLSKSARKDYRRHKNRAADQNIEVTSQSVLAPLDRTILKQALALVQNVDRHHNSPSHPYGRELLENAHMVDAVWLTAEIGERFVGCGLVLGDKDIQFLTLLGLDYEIQYTYFQLVYAAIHSAIESGIRVLRGGSGAYEMKQRLGFHLESNNHAVFAGRGMLLQKFGHWVATIGQE